jgi:hypothetical protein
MQRLVSLLMAVAFAVAVVIPAAGAAEGDRSSVVGVEMRDCGGDQNQHNHHKRYQKQYRPGG